MKSTKLKVKIGGGVGQFPKLSPSVTLTMPRLPLSGFTFPPLSNENIGQGGSHTVLAIWDCLPGPSEPWTPGLHQVGRTPGPHPQVSRLWGQQREDTRGEIFGVAQSICQQLC